MRAGAVLNNTRTLHMTVKVKSEMYSILFSLFSENIHLGLLKLHHHQRQFSANLIHSRWYPHTSECVESIIALLKYCSRFIQHYNQIFDNGTYSTKRKNAKVWYTHKIAKWIQSGWFPSFNLVSITRLVCRMGLFTVLSISTNTSLIKVICFVWRLLILRSLCSFLPPSSTIQNIM